jgi:hypothetical protein
MTEDIRVGSESRRHGTRDDFLILLQVRDSSEGKAPVSDLNEC